MEFVPLAVASTMVWKLSSFAKFVIAGETNKAVTQLVVWVIGVAVAFLLAASDFAEEIAVGGHSLGSLNGAAVILFGFALGSVAAVGYDALSKNPEPKLIS